MRATQNAQPTQSPVPFVSLYEFRKSSPRPVTTPPPTPTPPPLPQIPLSQMTPLPLSAICSLGQNDSMQSVNPVRRYTQKECENIIGGNWYPNGECLKKNGGSWSDDCRPQYLLRAGSSDTTQIPPQPPTPPLDKCIYRLGKADKIELVPPNDPNYNPIARYTKDECDKLDGIHSLADSSGYGECIKKEGGSWSWDCRPTLDNVCSLGKSDTVPQTVFKDGISELQPKLRRYTQKECEDIIKGKWYSNGECIKKEGGSWSFDCRPVDSTEHMDGQNDNSIYVLLFLIIMIMLMIYTCK